MAFDFPASPSEGQIFNAPSGPSYVFNSPVWKAIGQGQIAIVSDTAPANPANGALWWESDTGILFLWYNDGTSSQWVQVGGGAATVGAQTRNRVVNPAMQISQENGNTAGTANSYYAADQWMVAFGSTGTFTTQRVQSITPNGSKDRLRLTITVADVALGATDFLQILQRIEGNRTADFRYGLASAKQTILRFGFKGPAGTYALSIANNPQNRSYVALITISAGQANTDTEQVFVVPGDTTGTWLTDTGNGIQISILLACGSTYQGTIGWQAGQFLSTSAASNGMATAGAVFELFDVGLYLDPQNTGVAPAWQMPDEAQELIVCQRYWQTSGTAYITSAYGGAGGGWWQTYFYPVTMRIAPAIALGGPTYVNASAASSFTASPTSWTLTFTVTAAGHGRVQLGSTYNARM